MPFEDDVNSYEQNKVKNAKYSEKYQQVVFQIWYSNDRPSPAKLKEMLPADEYGRVPFDNTLSEWISVWDFDADRLDLKVKESLELSLIQERANMLKRQAEIGMKLQEWGMKFFEDRDENPDKAQDAIKAIVEGTRIERDSRGLGEALERIMKMDDDALKKELVNLLNRDVTVVDSTALESDDADEIPTE